MNDRLKIFFFGSLIMLLLPGCYDMKVRITELPANTPPSDNIYISGNFNNWDPGDPAYLMVKNSDSVYEVMLPKGIGSVEFKFTRGDWSTVEKDPCGYEIDNRVAFYGRQDIVGVVIDSWNDLPKPDCPKLVIIIDSLPEGKPNDALYIAGNFNDWDPGNRYWMLSQGLDGKYYIEIPRPDDEPFEYKITRGNWSRVECRADGEDIENRTLHGKAGDVVYITIEAWRDRL
jgi:hypothetical protein